MPGAQDQLGRVALQELAGAIHDVQVPPLVADARRDASRPDPFSRPGGALFVQTERLLDEDGDPAVRGCEFGFIMRLGRNADEDGIEAGLLEHRSIVRVGAGASRLREPSGRLQAPRRNRDHGDVVEPGQDAQVHAGDPPGPDETDPCRGHPYLRIVFRRGR